MPGCSHSSTHTLQPVPPLVPFLSDLHLLLILPTIVYWVYGLLFYWVDQNGHLSAYRLHTPGELLKRNRVPMSKVVYSILFYQFLTTALGFWLMRNAEPDIGGREDYDIATWALRIREIRHGLRILLLVSAKANSANNEFPSANYSREDPYVSGYRSWELIAAKGTYYYLVPVFQFAVAVFVADTWQYFEHRIVHINHYLYTNFHAVHHRIYVPYAFGAFYSNIYEQFVVDVFGTYLAVNVPGLSTRQATAFVTLSTLKAAHDHCGYSIPWHPFEFLTGQNALYHDIHHQSWGIKTNYSQLYTTFWDRVLGTMWEGDGAVLAKRYEGVTEVDVGARWGKWGERGGKATANEGVRRKGIGEKGKVA